MRDSAHLVPEASGPDAALLTEAQVATFHEKGFLTFDPRLPVATLDRALTDLLEIIGPPRRTAQGLYFGMNRIQDAWRMSAAVKAIALHPCVLQALAQLYDRRPLPFQTLNFPVGTEQLPHSDTIHFNSDPASFMCGVWVALEDVDMENGPLVYYPGSQALPEVRPRELGPEVLRRMSWVHRALSRTRHLKPYDANAGIYQPFYEPHIGALIERLGLVPEYGTIRRGEAIIWSANLLHGGSPRRDRFRSRHSQVTHYFFENCRYYTPLLETTDLLGRPIVHWRKPGWIT